MAIAQRPLSELTAPEAKPSTPAPPIPDSNGNGVLDGEDIFAALTRDAQHYKKLKAQQPTLDPDMANLPAIRLMQGIGIRTLAEVLAQNVDSCTERTLRHAAISIEDSLKSEYLEKYGTEPDNAVRQRVSTAVPSFASENGLTHEIAKNLLFSGLDFAHSFRKTFPNGMSIKAEEVVPILGLFDDEPKRIVPGICKSSQTSPPQR